MLINNLIELKLFKAKLLRHKSTRTTDFMSKNWHMDKSTKAKARAYKYTAKDIHSDFVRSTFKIKLDIPHRKMLNEARALKNHFVPHRKSPNDGWESICIHGLGDHKTEHFTEYEYKERPYSLYNWTEISKNCPVTVNWLKNTFPYSVYFRVRFMLLKPGGFIVPHNDLGGKRGFAAVNVSLNQPTGCMMFMEKFGLVPWSAGDIRLMDIGINHSVINLSSEDRYHMIIHGYPEGEKKIAYSNLLSSSV